MPILNNRPNLKDRINDFNRAMRETLSVINNNNIVWINLSDILRDDDMTQDTIHLTIAEKRRVVFHIYRSIICSAPCRRSVDVDVTENCIDQIVVNISDSENFCKPLPGPKTT